MINIAICDDDALSLEIIRDIIADYAECHYDDFHIETFPGAFDLSEAIEQSGSFDIYLLDIIMPLENGMELAQKLRATGDRGKIIFVSSSMDFILDSFGVRAFQYILKPVDRNKLFNILDASIEELKRENSITIEVKARDGYHRISPEYIYYVESVNRVLIYHLKDKSQVETTTIRISFSESMTPLLQDRRFILAGSSLLINLSAVEAMDKGYIRMKNGVDLFPPERAFASLRNAWKELG